MTPVADAPRVHYAAAMKESTTCWAISDGAAGNERQALALARALGLEPRVLRIRLRQPWDAFAPRLRAGAMQAIRDEHGAALAPPWPDLAIGCGRRAALATRLLRTLSAGRSWTVQILDPRIDSRAFDLVIAPAHDRVTGANVIHSIGALNPVDRAWLTDGRARFAHLAELPMPRTTVLIGASNRAQRLDHAVERLGAVGFTLRACAVVEEHQVEIGAEAELAPAEAAIGHYHEAAGVAVVRSDAPVRGDHGYRSVAIHPNAAAFWNRARAYPALGFSRFVDAASFPQDRIVGLFTSDAALTDRVLDELADDGPPQFVFAISMRTRPWRSSRKKVTRIRSRRRTHTS